MRESIERIFDSYINKKLADKHDVKRFIHNHCGKARCIDKIYEQVRLAEMSNIGGIFDAEKYRLVIQTGADLFVWVALSIVEQAELTQAERRRREDEANYIAEIEAEQDELRAEIESEKIVSYPSV